MHYLSLFYQMILFFSAFGVVCIRCRKWFSSQSTLIRHKIWHHKSTLPPFKYNCDQCPYGTFELTNFKKHALVHDISRPLECKECGNRFRLLQSLNTHLLIHYGECNRDFNCLF